MQIPIVTGIYADATGDFRTAYPFNMVPTPQGQGISEGYLRLADGLEQNGQADGAARGGIVYKGVLYRVQGPNLVAVYEDGATRKIGHVGGSNTVSMAYSFSHLAVASDGNLFLYDGNTLQQVTDPDLGLAHDVIWVDGYFMTTDGEFLVVTELNDPFSVSVLKYGSSEVDPDPVVALVKLRNEVHAVNRHTIEVFQNTGGENFPFSRVNGSQIQRGAVGTHGVAVYMDALAFVGGGLNEAPAVWMGANGSSSKISTAEIEEMLAGYSEAVLSDVVIEVVNFRNHDVLMIHLPDKCLCFDGSASKLLGAPAWYIFSSSIDGVGAYLGRHHVWAYDRWTVGDPTTGRLGYVSKDVNTHWEQTVGWQFSTQVIYNGGTGALFHELELVALHRAALGANPRVATQYSTDGATWSQPHSIRSGKQGDRNYRLRWLSQGHMQNFRLQRFTGTSDTPISVARLEARLEALAW